MPANLKPSSDAASPPELPRSLVALCKKCGRPIDRHFSFCPYCGYQLHAGHRWYHDPVWIAVLALFVIGPFALPLVWRSARLNRTLKFIYTAVILVYTAVTVYYLFQVVTETFRVFSDLGEVLQY